MFTFINKSIASGLQDVKNLEFGHRLLQPVGMFKDKEIWCRALFLFADWKLLDHCGGKLGQFWMFFAGPTLLVPVGDHGHG